MILLDFMHHSFVVVADLWGWLPHGSGVDLLQGKMGHGFGSLLAQGQFDTDVFAGFRSAFNNFIQSGQVWALLVGIVLGYLIRGLTSY